MIHNGSVEKLNRDQSHRAVRRGRPYLVGFFKRKEGGPWQMEDIRSG
nr:MAG TPA: Integrin alpha-L, Alpha L, Beta 2 [Caudoviricetes sp.]